MTFPDCRQNCQDVFLQGHQGESLTEPKANIPHCFLSELFMKR